MTESSDNLFSSLSAAGGRLRNDLAEMLAARSALVQLELTESARQTARCGVALTIALVLLVSCVPIAVATLALAGATYFAQSPIYWLAASAVLLIAAAALVVWCAIRNFRRDFTGLRETLAELREDLVWLREWSGQADVTDGPASDAGVDQPV